MVWRGAVTLAALAAFGFANASFDLVMVLDSTSKSIHRFDGMTGAYFGSFGGGWLGNVLSMSVDQSRSRAYVLESGGVVSRWNYNTGEYQGSFGVLSSAIGIESVPTVGGVAAYSSTTAFLYNGGGTGQIGSFTVPSGRTLASLGFANNRMYGLLKSPEEVVRYPATGGAHASIAPSSNLSTLGGRSNYLGYAFAGVAVGVLVLDPATGSLVSVAQRDATSLVLGIKGVTIGHEQLLYAAGTDPANPAQGVVARYDAATNSLRGSFGQGFLQTPVDIDMVVAPEPGTLAALGLGLAALVRRRKRR